LGYSYYDTSLLMTDPSITMAGGNEALIKDSCRQRETVCEMVFEKLGVNKFGLVAA
jgi:hypothetical protein